jgi:hypothetical protein
MNHIPTNNLKIASALAALGIKLREPDSVTCEHQIKDGRAHDQFIFWFDDDPGKVKPLLNAAYAFLHNWEYTLPENHPIYMMLGCLYNRETFLKRMRDATPFVRIEKGSTTVLMPVNASEKLKKDMRKHL